MALGETASGFGDDKRHMNEMWRREAEGFIDGELAVSGVHEVVAAQHFRDPHGGVVNDHHGVGIKLGRFMREQYGDSMIVFEALKKALDPNGIMNPYKMGL